MKKVVFVSAVMCICFGCYAGKLKISGIYPHLVMYNQEGMRDNFGEAGIGALAPWGGKLWGITYTCHSLRGSTDKLYEIDKDLNKIIRPESVGGTHANRMIHRESQQLIIGPYFIKKDGTVRVAKFPDGNYGRLTAVTRHLFKPESMVYFYDMEGIWYEVDVDSLEVTKLHNKPVPGWHGKGAYVGQGRFIVANNGAYDAPSAYWRSPRHNPEVAKMLNQGYLARYKNPDDPENAGILAEFDGENWNVIEARQYTDVSGPGGLYGNSSQDDPVWAIGWDKRSLRLKVLDEGKWHTYLLPKASHSFEHESGVYTEWPRFRAISEGKWMLDMFGMFFDWPRDFNSADTSGISPISTHLRYIPDFGHWDGKVFLTADDAAKVTNPIPPGLNQSNIWFGNFEQLKDFGPVYSWGGPWLDDEVKAGQPSTQFLVNGFENRMIHISHNSDTTVDFTIEIDEKGNNHWKKYKTLTVSNAGYDYYIFPDDLKANWMRLTASKDCKATAYFFLNNKYDYKKLLKDKFSSLAQIDSDQDINTGLLWPDTDLGLQFVQKQINGCCASEVYKQVSYDDEKNTLEFSMSNKTDINSVKNILPVEGIGYKVDRASVIYEYNGKKYRLPKGSDKYCEKFPEGFFRSHREVQSERGLINVQGTFYELPRERIGIPSIKPVSTHSKRIKDYCSWRGLLVISGTRNDAEPDGNYFGNRCGGLWFGNVDDIWQLGKPTGKGGPLKDTFVKAGKPSDPYLMTRYDKKTVELSHNDESDVEFTLEIDFTCRDMWSVFKTIIVPAGKVITYEFPQGYHAHWVRVKTSKDCKGTALFDYE